MELKVQVFSIIFSMLYGIIFGLFYNLNYKFLYITLLRYKVLNNILFSIDIFLIYFVVMLKINFGDIRVLFLIIMFISFIISVNRTKSLRKIVNNLKINNKNHSNH